MIRLINWTAKRAGGRITVNGIDAGTMKPFKVVGVDMIEAGLVSSDGARADGSRLHPVATDKDGTQYELA